MDHLRRKKQAKVLRVFRKVHRITGAFLFAFFFFIAVSGLLLGWKKHSYGMILAKTARGTSSDLKEWLPLDSLYQKACQYLQDSVSAELSPEISRIDVRKQKGSVKFIFSDHYYGLQLDGVTGALLQIEQRRSDFIENIHDGSILDDYLGTPNNILKVSYTSIMGLALLVFTITGFWLWYGPKQMRKAARKNA